MNRVPERMEVATRPPAVEAMLDPAFYPHHPEAVDLRETHISWVFRVGELAYKVKKPIVLPFLDYGTLARRGRCAGKRCC